MKNIFIFIFFVSSTYSYSQGFRADAWVGKIQLPDTILKIDLYVGIQVDTYVFAILTIKNDLIGLVDTCFNGYELNLKEIKKNFEKKETVLYQQKKPILYRGVKFKGALADNKNQLDGELSLNDKVFPVKLLRDSVPIFRPQEPKRPFPYYCEEVVCQNPKDSTVLAGTLTLPQKEGKFPVVIYQSGNMPTCRDGDSNHHKHTLVFADYLTRNGIGVLRYDSRGVGKSKGDFHNSTPLDLSSDLIVWKDFLSSRKDIDKNNIGIVGHSEGGMVAAIAASQSNDLKFIVLLASPGLKLRDVFEKQIQKKLEEGEISQKQYEEFQEVNKKIYSMIDLNLCSKAMEDSLMKYKKTLFKNFYDTRIKDSSDVFKINRIIKNLIFIKTSPHMIFNLTVNPSDYIQKVTCPVLSLGGSNDLHVSTKENQEAIRQALKKAGNNNFQIIELEGLNHSFQECEKGTLKEALKIEQTFSPKALEIITKWIKSLNQ